jgi:hypothetical protein
MPAINDYIRNLTKCRNTDCTLKTSCLRYSATAPGRYKLRDGKCNYYFRLSDDESIEYLKKMFGMK